MPKFNPEMPASAEEEIKIIDGQKYRKVASGYTIREYYSHQTETKGPGPGWDYKQKVLQEYGVDEPSQLPDDPHYAWELIEE